MLGNGAFQFQFSYNYSQSIPFLDSRASATNLGLPVNNWTVAGAASNIAPGLFQFTTQSMTNNLTLLHPPLALMSNLQRLLLVWIVQKLSAKALHAVSLKISIVSVDACMDLTGYDLFERIPPRQ